MPSSQKRERGDLFAQAQLHFLGLCTYPPPSPVVAADNPPHDRVLPLFFVLDPDGHALDLKVPPGMPGPDLGPQPAASDVAAGGSSERAS